MQDYPERSEARIRRMMANVVGCCTLIPLGLLLLIAPILAAGQGWKSFLWTAGIEIALLIGMGLMNLSLILNNTDDWRTALGVMIGTAIMVIAPITLGTLVLYARRKEEGPRANICRVCGYDLRATPDRCPECGTPVKFDPNQF